MSSQPSKSNPDGLNASETEKRRAALAALRVVVASHPAPDREALARRLERINVRVVGEAADGREAIERARALHPDLILMGLEMPNCDGIEATRVIMVEAPETKIVITMSARDGDGANRARQAGASLVINKEISETELAGVLMSIVLPDPVDESRAAASPASDDLKGSVDLDPVERRVLVAIAEGTSRPEVARSLGVSEEMIDRHVANVLDKLHRHSDCRSAEPLSSVGSEPEEDSERPTTFGS